MVGGIHAREIATEADGTHATGMHSCKLMNLSLTWQVTRCRLCTEQVPTRLHWLPVPLTTTPDSTDSESE